MSASDKHVCRLRGLMGEMIMGRGDPDAFFCMCLSVLGDSETRTVFLDLIEPLLTEHESLHLRLTSLFLDFFAEKQEDELDLALTVSLYDYEESKAESGRHSSDGSPAVPPAQSTHTEGKDGSEEQPAASRDTGDPQSTCKHQPQKSSRSRRRKQKRKQQDLLKSPSAPGATLLWFRRDLRMWDNPALIGCLELGGPVIPVFLWNAAEEEGPGVTVAAGGASKYWLHHALVHLNLALEQRGSHLVSRKSERSSLKALQELIAESGATSVVATALYEPWLKARDETVWKALEKQGIQCHIHHSYCLQNPHTLSTRGVGLRGIGSVSHFISCCHQNPEGRLTGAPLDAPHHVPAAAAWPQSCLLDELGLARMPRRKDGTEIDWAVNIRESWDFSEDGAHVRLEAFLKDGVHHYEKESSRADVPNTSALSPYLHFGQLSARWLLWDARGSGCRAPKFQRKLAWRDLAYWQLSLFPEMPWEPIRPAYKTLRWSGDRAHLKAWQRGHTGYPLVDAAMRQLWVSGWMNNYMRHVVASFLVAYLHIHWLEGFRWFQDTLLDADVAIDAMMWQNGGMSGLDHWNFVMHPVNAALTCDPNGTYVRRWCPELKKLPDDLIHKPWKCPASVLKRADVVLGTNYPDRIVVDLEECRWRSLRDVAFARNRFPEFIDQRSSCDLVPVPDRLLQECWDDAEVVVRPDGGMFFPVITRMEFKYQSEHPDRQENPYSAVLKGYVSRRRDQTVAFLNQRDFAASVMEENARRKERMERDHRVLEGLPSRNQTRDHNSKVSGKTVPRR